MKSKTVKNIEAEDFLDYVMDRHVGIAKAWLKMSKVHLTPFKALT